MIDKETGQTLEPTGLTREAIWHHIDGRIIGVKCEFFQNTVKSSGAGRPVSDAYGRSMALTIAAAEIK